MKFTRQFPFFKQLDSMDCGPTCLRMIAQYYGKSYSLHTLRERAFISKEGVSMYGISEAAESIGFRTMGVRISLDKLRTEMPLPCILHWRQRHFVVCYKVKKHKNEYLYYIADPATQLIKYNELEIRKCWLSTMYKGQEVGMALVLTPSPSFYKKDGDNVKQETNGMSFLYKYLYTYKYELFQVILGLVLISVIQMIFPFLTQSLVDIGIKSSNLNFITLILIAQLSISFFQTIVDFVRGWIFLNMNTQINIALISDFLIKLMKLPMRYFESRMVGDILQRIDDHKRIESFLTGTSITTIFSVINFIIFSFILCYYNSLILTVYVVGNFLYIVWVLIFLKKRRELDVRRFVYASGEQSNLIQLVTAMQDIKINNCERQKRWQWEQFQVKLYKIGMQRLSLSQLQKAGSVCFNQTTNIIISYMAAKMVVENNMTLGMMMALTYIIGQLNGPVNSFIGFIQQLQDARISLERLNEIHSKNDEYIEFGTDQFDSSKESSIELKDVSFSYNGDTSDYVIKNISAVIPYGKVTAIVGASGSGKTTLMKLLLGFFIPTRGEIKLGGVPLSSLEPSSWRKACGVVMQDGFIYSDTILNNIALGEDQIDKVKLEKAVKMANIEQFILSLPHGYDTKIGMEGNGISQGQKQRILIARAIYRNAQYLFLDEATNALDSRNEKNIITNLDDFYKDKTVLVIAHRLSTIKNADNILVLDNGCIVESGTHAELLSQKGYYYQLVKPQIF